MRGVNPMPVIELALQTGPGRRRRGCRERTEAAEGSHKLRPVLCNRKETPC